MPAKTRLAQLIARHREGFGIATSEIDMEDLERDLRNCSKRGRTLRSTASLYAPVDENEAKEYLQSLCSALDVLPDCTVSAVLAIPASSEGR